MLSDSTLQIFLTIYHGSLIGNFFYDYVIRNAVHLFLYGAKWTYVSNICIGALFIAVIIWAILSVWSKVKRNLLICCLVLLVMFIVRLSVGIPDLMDRQRTTRSEVFKEDMAIFIAQMTVHLFGIVATYLLAQKN
jgi:hypothetical protein